MARPKNKFSTSQKTWMFYDEDINALLDSGKAPKDVFRLGIMALQKGWSPVGESSQVGDLKDRIKSMSWTLQSYIEKFNKLAQIVEKGLKVEIDPEVVKTKELEARLQEIENLENSIKKSRKNETIK